MQTVCTIYAEYAISQTMKSQGRSVLQYNAKQDLILISKKKFFDMLVICVFFVTKEWQYRT